MRKYLIYCVFKKGGCYTPLYVERLKKAVENNTTLPIEFICLTDDPDIDFCKTIALKYNYPGWWSKIELFRSDLQQKPALYLDLDTIVCGNIDQLLKLSVSTDFMGLQGYNKRYTPINDINFASGIMAGPFYKFNIVHELFEFDPEYYMNFKPESWMHGDQGFIYYVLRNWINVRLQNLLPKDYIIGKKLFRRNNYKIPSNTRVIAWSGEPRLHTIKETYLSQINQIWRECGK